MTEFLVPVMQSHSIFGHWMAKRPKVFGEPRGDIPLAPGSQWGESIHVGTLCLPVKMRRDKAL